MRILLPPSEGKTSPSSGDPVSLASLVFADALTPLRSRLVSTLQRVSGQKNALEVLGVGKSLLSDVEANRLLLDAPASAAHQVYSGVLYDAARLGEIAEPGLSPVRIFSALWGVVRATDAIPAYRMSGGVDLPRLGSVAALWRKELKSVLDTELTGELIVDCRSGTYQQMWRGSAAAQVVPVAVFTDVRGVRKSVSHHAKHTRGILAGHLLRRSAPAPTTPEELADAARELLGKDLTAVQLTDSRSGKVLELDIAPTPTS